MKFLFENFDILAQAPGGVKKLREMILQFAVQGKLVKQDPNDEPASVLLEKIKAEKERLVKEGKIKKQKPLEPIRDDEIPFELSKGWVWCRLNDALDVRDGTHDSPKYQSTGIPLVTSKNLYTGILDMSNVKYISEVDYQKIKQRSAVDVDDILFAMIGSIGNPVKVSISDDFGIKNVALFKYYDKELSVPDYIKIFLDASSNFMRNNAAGGVQNFVSLTFLRNFVIPLPPMAEQKRIVAKVDSLMALCDDLDKQQQEKAEKKLTLNKASLHALNSFTTKQDFNKNWNHITKNFDLLFSTPENVNDLKQAILELAVQGKLVPQDPNDEPASVLLEKIKEEKERLVKEGKVKKQKPFEPIKENEIPLELPKGWAWVRLNELGFFSGGGTPSKNKKIYWDGKIPWVSPKDMKSSYIKKTEMYITEEGVNKSSAKKIPIGSLLIVGRSGILKRKLPVAINKVVCTVNQDLKVIVPYYVKMNTYLFTMLNGYESFILTTLTKYGMTVHSLKYSEFENSFFPIPPENEQKRIVAKVDSLMALCDRLSKSLVDKETKSEKMLNAVINQL